MTWGRRNMTRRSVLPNGAAIGVGIGAMLSATVGNLALNVALEMLTHTAVDATKNAHD